MINNKYEKRRTRDYRLGGKFSLQGGVLERTFSKGRRLPLLLVLWFIDVLPGVLCEEGGAFFPGEDAILGFAPWPIDALLITDDFLKLSRVRLMLEILFLGEDGNFLDVTGVFFTIEIDDFLDWV